MRKVSFLAVFTVLATVAYFHGKDGAKTAPDWAMNATTIEACTCPMFCQCYFHTSPASHSHAGMMEHFCRFNMGYKVNHGHYGKTKLDGARFWVAGDLGGDWSQGNTDWVVVTFDPAVTPEQREGISTALTHLFPVKWKSMSMGPDAKIEWTASVEKAEARLDGGKAAEVVLKQNPGMTSDPTVISNLRYFGAPRNDGFILMPNEVNAYRLGDKAFESRGSNGFMTTIDITSKDVAQRGGM